jgi:hypothetical protein
VWNQNDWVVRSDQSGDVDGPDNVAAIFLNTDGLWSSWQLTQSPNIDVDACVTVG